MDAQIIRQDQNDVRLVLRREAGTKEANDDEKK
jgi:hypothetical protein